MHWTPPRGTKILVANALTIAHVPAAVPSTLRHQLITVCMRLVPLLPTLSDEEMRLREVA